MAQPRKIEPYAICYNDGTYLIYDLETNFDIPKLYDAITRKEGVELSVGFFVTSDIRSVIKQKPQPEPTPEPPVQSDPNAIPIQDEDTIEWLKRNVYAPVGDPRGFVE